MQIERDSDHITVLIADDDTQICNFAQAVLARDGYDTMIACDGQQALEASRHHAGPIHLLLSDVQMPRLNGPELCQQIRRERQEIMCVLMSGNVCAASMTEEMPFIEKPFTPDVLRRKVRDLLKRPAHSERSPGTEQPRRSAVGTG